MNHMYVYIDKIIINALPGDTKMEKKQRESMKT